MPQEMIHAGKPFAVYAEFARDQNVKMKNGLNRRVFNVTEIEHGHDIFLAKDGSIVLHPGTYRITGFSMVTMQATMVPPFPMHGTNYPGYCLLYRREHEDNDPLGNNICIGSPATALDGTPSVFDLVFTCQSPTHICVGHQVGEANDEVYLSVYDVAGVTSMYHCFARIAINKL